MIDASTKGITSRQKERLPFYKKLNSSVIALIVLIICEVLWFGHIIGRIGFYLDDWVTYSNLSLSAQDLPSLINTACSDGRIVIRPIAGLFFIVFWKTFGFHPLWLHITNCTFEILSSWFCYLTLFKLSKNHCLALLASLLMLVYPSHDATHYWAIMSTFSLMLYMFSLWQTLCAIDNGKIKYSRLLLAGLAYLASLLNYEAFMPLCIANFVCIFCLLKRATSLRETVQKSILAFCPFLLSVLILLVYQRVVLSSLAIAEQHMIICNASHFIKVMHAGLNSTLTPIALNFFTDRVRETSAFIFTVPYMVSTILLVITIVTGLLLPRQNEDSNFFHPFVFVGLGILIFCSSYSIYGITNEYMPVLNSLYNRINSGGAVGSALIISGLFGIAYHLTSQLKMSSMISCLKKTTFISAATSLIIFLIVTDWGMSLPWITSWSFQQSVMNAIRTKRTELHSGDSVLLADAPRYVMWAPVFDGVWDFQSMLRYVTRNKKINGGVISERLVLSKDSAKDISLGYLCATYPFHHLYLLVMSPKQWISINSADDFIATISTKGMDSGLTKSALVSWKNQLATSNQSQLH